MAVNHYKSKVLSSSSVMGVVATAVPTVASLSRTADIENPEGHFVFVPPTPRHPGVVAKPYEEKKSLAPPPIAFSPICLRGIPTRSARSGPALPPALQTSPEVAHTFRFAADAALTAANITVRDVIAATGNICIVANSDLNSFASCVKVKSLTVWAPSSSSMKSIALSWAAESSGREPDEVVNKAVPAGMTLPSSLVFVPPSWALAGFWQIGPAAPTAVMFQISVPAGAIVDLSVSLRLSNTQTPVQSTVGSAALGSVYYLALDGPGSNKLLPLGLPTTS
jgi:hypothetical protein